ncbi:glutamate racemase [Streptomyces sp. RLB3-17]|uniref:glutamate racemase n=1 Tax=unclassified Streptomyces TaxID=2593676 RepID=UPI001164C11C|nr:MULTISPECIES: glutamate racemase [unclassified Streptomyces]NMI56000.1 glutamate racemase [Streptomyces sp. RLA2-12]QDN55457.1 glutamate racemase [Streptomyces sp. S1D4-20]QDN65635.1 glutamate racemase [Streptomyces sp. S1D4-14]QDN96277.1 glutamate racemase [Streptomyces sp. RLB1-9]QDO17986.1 glutamate racemase [Streptomyces sp. S1A1-8]
MAQRSERRGLTTMSIGGIYLGDSARQPYGPRQLADVRRMSLECLDQLVGFGVKAVVIACNTASAAVVRDARERYQVPVIEVVGSASRMAASATKNFRIGVVCTEATRVSRAYEDSFAAAPHINLITKACPPFVDFVEAGVTTGPELASVTQQYLTPLVEADIDTLILGCTHYPLISEAIAGVMGERVGLVSSAEAAAHDLAACLNRLDLCRPISAGRPSHLFLTTGDVEYFEDIGSRFLGLPFPGDGTGEASEAVFAAATP